MSYSLRKKGEVKESQKIDSEREAQAQAEMASETPQPSQPIWNNY